MSGHCSQRVGLAVSIRVTLSVQGFHTTCVKQRRELLHCLPLPLLVVFPTPLPGDCGKGGEWGLGCMSHSLWLGSPSPFSGVRAVRFLQSTETLELAWTSGRVSLAKWRESLRRAFGNETVFVEK